jgi:hypothetical protein
MVEQGGEATEQGKSLLARKVLLEQGALPSWQRLSRLVFRGSEPLSTPFRPMTRS